MNLKYLTLSLATSVLLLGQAGAQAQTTPTPPTAAAVTTNIVTTQMQDLIKQVRAKLKDGKKTEAELAPELKAFDDLIAAHPTEKDDAIAQVLFMKAQLYLEVIENTEKGTALIQQLKTDYPDTKLGKRADKILAGIEKQKAAKQIQAGLATGADFPDFAEKDLNGQPLSVGGLKGKVVLVDFWATWCGPCRGELPNVIATYKKHHAEGFEIIGVSLDSERPALDEFLKKQDGMTWPQFYDGQGWGNKLAVKYGVESIPFAVLVGPDGKIIGKELRGQELEDAVAGALAKK